MTAVADILRDRFFSGLHVGKAKPSVRVFVRQGHFDRRYAPWAVDGRSLFNCWILGHKGNPWQASWNPTTPYSEVPNILAATFDQGFDNHGIQTANITVENVIHEQFSGIAGVFHKIRRGYLAPLRGFTLPTYPELRDPLTGEVVTTNSWFQLLNSNAQVTVWAGYGDGSDEGMVPVFTGLIDTLDATSHPDQLVISARDFGQVLSDQPVFGWVKDRRLKDPIVFADRRKADDIIKEGKAARASSMTAGHPPRFVLDKDGKTGEKSFWLSTPHPGPDNTEYIEIRLPQGAYEDFLLHPYFAGQECWVSFYAAALRPTAHNPDPRPWVNGVRANAGWVDLGKGNVPGTSVPFTVHIPSTSARSRNYGLGFGVFTGDSGRLRIYFRKLKKSHFNGEDGYRAGVRRLAGLRRRQSQQSVQEQWIRVDDLADVVKCVLRWGGFKEWEIEDTGVSLSDPLVVNRQNKLIDIVNKMSDLTGYVFAIQPPDFFWPGDNGPNSIGVPIWRRSTIFNPYRQDRIEVVKDSDLLTGVKAHFTDEPLAHVILVRGKVATAAQGGKLAGGGGQGVAAERRIQHAYYPPWGGVFGVSGHGLVNFGSDRLGGLSRPLLHIDDQLRTEFECHMGCMLIALQQALASATGVIEFPYYPGVELDDLLGVQDTGTGMNSRIYVMQKTASYDNGKFTMTVQGSWTDTPDMLGIVADWFRAIQDYSQAEEARNRRVVAQRKPPKRPTKRKK